MSHVHRLWLISLCFVFLFLPPSQTHCVYNRCETPIKRKAKARLKAASQEPISPLQHQHRINRSIHQGTFLHSIQLVVKQLNINTLACIELLIVFYGLRLASSIFARTLDEVMAINLASVSGLFASFKCQTSNLGKTVPCL